MTGTVEVDPVADDATDFGLDPCPGGALHERLHALRVRGPVQPARFMGQPCHVIVSDAALGAAFRDERRFPGHRMYAASFEPAIGPTFISEPDPERHLRMRRLTTPAFRSRAVSRFAATGLTELAHELIDALGDRDRFDLVESFTARFPYLAITRLLGLPRDREDAFHAWALALLTFRDDPSRAALARRDLSGFLAPVIEARRRAPKDDVISALVASEIDGRRLDDEAIACHVRLLFPTGGETTHGALGNLLHALLTHEGEWDRLAREPGRIEAAIEEGLRWETPIAVLPRMTGSEPVRFEGVELPADSWVLFAIAGANRDPAVFDDPDRFDPARAQPPNLVFGRGPKSCPGLHFAKRNMAVALRVLVERFPALELEDIEAARPRRTVLRSPDALRVRRLR